MANSQRAERQRREILGAVNATSISRRCRRDVRAREHDPLKNGMLIGLGVGAALGSAWCIGAIADDSGDIDARVECAEGAIVFPGLGTLIGLAIDAAIPGRMRLVYQTSPSRGGTRSLAVSFTF